MRKIIPVSSSGHVPHTDLNGGLPIVANKIHGILQRDVSTKGNIRVRLDRRHVKSVRHLRRPIVHVCSCILAVLYDRETVFVTPFHHRGDEILHEDFMFTGLGERIPSFE